MTTLLMILGAMAIGLGIGLMDPGKPNSSKRRSRNNPRKNYKGINYGTLTENDY